MSATSSGCRQPWPAPAEADGLVLGLGVELAEPDDPDVPDVSGNPAVADGLADDEADPVGARGR